MASKQTDHRGGGGDESEEFDILEEVVAPRTAPVVSVENDQLVKDLEAKMAGMLMAGGTATSSPTVNPAAGHYHSPADIKHDGKTKEQSHQMNVVIPYTVDTAPTEQKQHGDLAAVGIPKDGGSQQQNSSGSTNTPTGRRRQQQHPGAYAMSVGGGQRIRESATTATTPNNNDLNAPSSTLTAATLPPPSRRDILSQESGAATTNNNNQMNQAHYDDDDDAGMVPVANLVADHNDNLPRAHPEMPSDLEGGGNNSTDDNTTITAATTNSNKTTKRNILFAVIGSLVLALILLAILWPGGKSNEQSNNGNNNNNINDDSTQQENDVPSSTNSGSLDQQQEADGPVSKEDYLLSLLPSETVASIQHDSTSPQALAFDWLLKDQNTTTDNRNEEEDDTSVPSYRLRQRYALATLFFATKGEGWLKNTYWLSHDIHECDWYYGPSFGMNNVMSQYIERYQEGLFPIAHPPLRCDVKGRYQHLWLSQNKLEGSIPEEIYWMLPSLKTMDWSFNSIDGKLSTHIGRLTNLEGFFTFGQVNGGPIPSEIGQLMSLRFMGLMQNDHTGQIPSELWQLTNLETLSLNFNPQLTGTIPPTIGNLSNLRHALFHYTGLSGTIPTEIGLAKSIEWLVFIGNSMNGTLPSQVGLLEKMLHVDIGSTAISGTIPTEIGAWKSVGNIILDSNLLEGTIPQQLEELTKLNLTLDLHNNFLSGTIPTSLGLSTSLREISLRNNNFVGPIPSEIGNIPTLEMLSLANNSLTGEVPVQLSEMHSSLYKIQLDGNPLLSGIIPENLCNVNGICTENAVNPCETSHLGLSFDCTNLLCGCSCPCEGFSKQNEGA